MSFFGSTQTFFVFEEFEKEFSIVINIICRKNSLFFWNAGTYCVTEHQIRNY